MAITIKQERAYDSDNYELIRVKIDDEQVFLVDYDPDCPEDNNLSRNFSCCTDMLSLIKKAYELGREGKEVEFVSEEIEVEGELAAWK